MKKSVFLILALAVFFSCSKNNEEPKPACKPAKATLKMDDTIEFNFNDDGTIGTVSINPGTDSVTTYTYTWQDDKLSKIAVQDNDIGSYNLTPVYDDNDLVKLASDVGFEIRYAYSGGRIISRTDWLRGMSGTYFQFSEYKFSYDGSGNLVRDEFYLDLIVLFAIISGQDPTAPYNGKLMQTLEFAYTGNTGANPLRNTWFVEFPDISIMYNWPTRFTFIDPDDPNNPISNDFSITFNEQGYPERMESASITVTVTYNCN